MIRESKETWQDGFQIDVVNLLKWATAEELLVDKKTSQHDAILERLPEIDPHLLEFCKFLYRIDYHDRLKIPLFDKKINFKKLQGGNTPRQALLIFKFFAKIYLPTTANKVAVMLTKAVTDYLIASLKKLQISDREIAINLFELATDDIASYFWENSDRKIVAQWLKLDKNDPLFKIWNWNYSPNRPSQSAIKKVRNEAEKRHDSRALRELKKLFSSPQNDPVHNNKTHESSSPLPPDEEFFELNMLIETLAGMDEKTRIKTLQSTGMPYVQALELSKTIDLEIANNQSIEINSSTRQAPEKPTKKRAKKSPPKKEAKPKIDPLGEHPELPF